MVPLLCGISAADEARVRASEASPRAKRARYCVNAFFALARRYWGTFSSLQTGRDYVQKRFTEGDSDEKKKEIFTFNKKLWLEIRVEVKHWTTENWERWEEDKPLWFNGAFKASVDDDMIPVALLARMHGVVGGERKRSSVGEQLGFV